MRKHLRDTEVGDQVTLVGTVVKVEASGRRLVRFASTQEDPLKGWSMVGSIVAEVDPVEEQP